MWIEKNGGRRSQETTGQRHDGANFTTPMGAGEQRKVKALILAAVF
jgi:hypothetical protein